MNLTPLGAGPALDEKSFKFSETQIASEARSYTGDMIGFVSPQIILHPLQMILQHRLAEPRHAHCQHFNHQRRSHFCYREKGLVKLNHTAIIIELIVGELVCLLLGFSDVHGHFRLCST